MGTRGGEDMVLEAIVVGSRIMEVVTEEAAMEEVVIINTESTIFRDA
jgi:hypothetical protein